MHCIIKALALLFSLSSFDAEVYLKPFLMAAILLVPGKTFYTVYDTNKLFCIILLFSLFFLTQTCAFVTVPNKSKGSYFFRNKAAKYLFKYFNGK